MKIERVKIPAEFLIPLARAKREELKSDPESWTTYDIELIKSKLPTPHCLAPLDDVRRCLCNLRKRGALGTIRPNAHGKLKPKELSAEHQLACKRIRESDWWREVLRYFHHRCVGCGCVGLPLDVHHIHYESLGNERPGDVVPLCRECHKIITARRDKLSYRKDQFELFK